ncbi:MAG: dihydroorotate dehydrogenase [bacterium]|nr:dihydroorotate dehydrogenase [bacterium]
MVDLQKKLVSPVKIGNKEFPCPIWLASGTAGFGEELAELIDFNRLGGIVLKGTTLYPQEGNPPPRLVETPSGLINAIGLQNPGLDVVLNEKLEFFKNYKVPVILNIAGKNEDEYEIIAKKISESTGLQAVEINMSCPNVKKVMDNGTDPDWVERVTRKVKKNLDIPVIVKLTPNITDITTIAAAAEAGGADAVSLINTLKGMVFNIETQKPVIANKIGGLSGPAIRPVAVRMVYEVKQRVNIPVVGMGGIMRKEDIFEFFCAGADLVQLGTINFVNPAAINDFFS